MGDSHRPRYSEGILAVRRLQPHKGKNMHHWSVSGWKEPSSSARRKLKTIWVIVEEAQHWYSKPSALALDDEQWDSQMLKFLKVWLAQAQSAELMGDFLTAPDVSSFWMMRLFPRDCTHHSVPRATVTYFLLPKMQRWVWFYFPFCRNIGWM